MTLGPVPKVGCHAVALGGGERTERSGVATGGGADNEAQLEGRTLAKAWID